VRQHCWFTLVQQLALLEQAKPDGCDPQGSDGAQDPTSIPSPVSEQVK
jgi:hypothetical protein